MALNLFHLVALAAGGLLVAQAQLEGLTLVTADEKLAAYDGFELIQV